VNCARGVDLLADYLEDALPVEVRRDIDAHLAACPRCVAFVDSYLQSVRILRGATLADPPPGFEASLRRFLEPEAGT
jgi:anti-sigma factor RsiW